MSFGNKIFKISLFLLEEVKIGCENTKRMADVKVVKRKKAAKIRDQVFLATGIPSSPNTLRIIGHIGNDTYSEDSVQYWVARFQSGDTSCEDISRPGRPLIDLAEPFRLSLENCPFASPRMLSRHFSIGAVTFDFRF
jgi:hypothetical protein